MNCKNCGSKVDNTEIYCPACGEKLKTTAQESSSSAFKENKNQEIGISNSELYSASEKIQLIAKILFVLGIIGSIGGGIAIMFAQFLVGLIVVVVGVVFSWIAYLFIHTFGLMAESIATQPRKK